MKRDKAQLIQAIEAIKAKLAVMEEELNKPDEYKHFPSKDDKYYYYVSTGTLCDNTASNDDLKVNVFKTKKEAYKAYNKAVAVEKVKRRLLELQGDWEPNWEDTSNKYTILYSYNNSNNRFFSTVWQKTKYPVLIPFIETKYIATTIIEEMEDELKFIFDIA